MKGVTVCHGCRNRHVGCHAECKDYKHEKAILDAEKELRRKAGDAKNAVSDVLYKKGNKRK